MRGHLANQDILQGPISAVSTNKTCGPELFSVKKVLLGVVVGNKSVCCWFYMQSYQA